MGDGKDIRALSNVTSRFLARAAASAPLARRGGKVLVLLPADHRNSTKGLDTVADIVADTQKKAARLYNDAGEAPPLLSAAWYSGWNDTGHTPWCADVRDFQRHLYNVEQSESGGTNYTSLLSHAVAEAEKDRLAGVLLLTHHQIDTGRYDNDSARGLIALAERMGDLQTPVHVLQPPPGLDEANYIFKSIAAYSGGVHATYNDWDAAALPHLLTAMTAFSTGSHGILQAMRDQPGPESTREIFLQLRQARGAGGMRHDR